MTELNSVTLSLPGSGHDVVRLHRQCAAKAFSTLGLPTTRDEDWKYTDLSRLPAAMGQDLWELTDRSEVPVPAAGEIEARAIPDLDAYQFVFIDGRFSSGDLSMPEGVTVRPLADLLEDKPDLAMELLELEEDAPLYNGFVALNAAMAADGICICIADGVCLDKPVYVLNINAHTAHVRHGIALGRNATATVIEHFSGVSDDVGLTNTMTNIRLSGGAGLSHYLLQQEPGKRFHYNRVEVEQKQDSYYDSHSIALGATLSRTDITVHLAGEGAQCLLNGLYITGGRQHSDHHTRVDHAMPNCTSKEMYKGILDGRSRAVFNGKVVVHENAQQTDAQQSNDNLLLSAGAEIDTKPELEIYADDVKCAHGATIGQMDEDQVFYLRTRGLAEADARSALTFAFAGDVLGRIPLPAVRSWLHDAVLEKLPQGKALEGL